MVTGGRRLVRRILVPLLIILLTPAVVRGADIVVGYIPVLPASALFVAFEKGYFRDEGVTVRLEPLPSGRDIVTMVANANFHVGLGALGAAAFNAIARKFDIEVVATLHAQSPTGPAVDPLVARKKSIDEGVIKTVADLKGKKVAINARGVATEYMVDQALRKGGLTIDDIDLVTMPFPDMVPALERGAIEAGILPEPLATLAKERGIAVRLVDDYAPGMQTTVLYYNRTFARERRDEARRFMVAYLRGIRDLMGGGWQSEQSATAINKYTKVPVPVILRSVPPYLHPDGALDFPSLRAQQAFLLRRGNLTYREPLAIEAVVNTEFLSFALSRLGPFRP